MQLRDRLPRADLMTIALVAMFFGYLAAVSPGLDTEKAEKVEPTPPEDTATTSEPARIIFPPKDAVLMSGTFDVIAKGPEPVGLKIDDRERVWEAFGPEVHVAHVGLSPGWHSLEADGKTFDFVVAINEEEHDGPSDWPIIRFHGIDPKKKRCAACHKTTEGADGQTTIGRFAGHRACFTCHAQIDFDVTHAHPLEPIEPCQICHSPHGSPLEGLLKAPAKKLCDECHEG